MPRNLVFFCGEKSLPFFMILSFTKKKMQLNVFTTALSQYWANTLININVRETKILIISKLKLRTLKIILKLMLLECIVFFLLIILYCKMRCKTMTYQSNCFITNIFILTIGYKFISNNQPIYVFNFQ